MKEKIWSVCYLVHICYHHFIASSWSDYSTYPDTLTRGKVFRFPWSRCLKAHFHTPSRTPGRVAPWRSSTMHRNHRACHRRHQQCTDIIGLVIAGIICSGLRIGIVGVVHVRVKGVMGLRSGMLVVAVNFSGVGELQDGLDARSRREKRFS